MKGCLLINRSFAKLGHAIALDLAERYGVDQWCGYLYGKQPFEIITQQKDIRYNPLLVDDIFAVEAEHEVVDEAFLAEKEKEYGHPFLWRHFNADRIFLYGWPKNFYVDYNPILNHEQIKQQLQYRIKKIERMFEEQKPDILIVAAVGSMGSNLLYHIAKKKGVACVVITDARLGDRQMLTESIYGPFTSIEHKLPLVKNGSHVIKNQAAAAAWIKEFRARPPKPYWAYFQEKRIIESPIRYLKNLVRKTIDSFDRSFPRVYDYSVITFVKRSFLMFVNQFRFPKYDVPDYSEDYAFFPLHYEPELALMMLAPYFTNQIDLIRNVAQSLPVNFKLYVKEHPSMATLRNPRYYKEIKKIPNVKLIDHRIDSIPLIRGSRIVTTVTGTAGWEATLLKKPVVTFGSVFFNDLSNVKVCGPLEQLPYVIKECLENFTYDEGELERFVALILEDSFDIDIVKLWNSKQLSDIRSNPHLTILSDEIMKFSSASRQRKS